MEVLEHVRLPVMQLINFTLATENVQDMQQTTLPA